MVCVPCIVIPVFLYIWHRFLQPLVLNFWHLWGTKEDKKVNEHVDSNQLEKKTSCPFSTNEKPYHQPNNSGMCNEEIVKKTS